MPDSDLNGAKKSAILLLALGVDIASMVLKHMSEGDIQRISNYMSHMTEVEPEDVDLVLEEFSTVAHEFADMVMGGEDYVRKVLLKTLAPDRANWILGNLSAPNVATGLEALKWQDAGTITRFLQGEHPQTVAVIMAHLEPEQAGLVLSTLDPEAQMDVVMRIAKLDRIPPGVIRDLDRVLQTELKAPGAQETKTVGGVPSVAKILQHVDKASEREVIERIEADYTEIAEEIRQLMFTFEDLLGLDDRGMQALLREVANDELTLSLKTASEELRDKILRNMSQRAAEMMREELEVMGPVRITDVERAQQGITQTVKRLEDEGKVVLMGKGDDSFV